MGYIDLFFFGLFLLFYTYSVVFKSSGVAEIHSPEIGFGILGIFILLGLYLIFYPNYKIEIKDLEIFKTNIFKYKRKIGNISEIDGFEENHTDVIVYKNNKKFFTYPIYGKEDNISFSVWLEKRFPTSNKLTIRGNQALYIIMYILSICWIFIILMCAEDEGIIQSIGLFRNTFVINSCICSF